MNLRRFGGWIVIIIGALSTLLSFYIKSRVAEAREDVHQGRGLLSPFTRNPIGEAFGKFVEGGAEKKIDEYEAMAKWSQIGGIILVILGTGVVIFSRVK